MKTVKELRAVLAEEVRRLQPPTGLESRVLQQAFGAPANHQARGVSSHGPVRPWESPPA